jgi:sulfate adenylyltransferase
MASLKTCPHDQTYHVTPCGASVSETLSRGEIPPVEFMRPEVAQVLIEGFSQLKESAQRGGGK